MFFDSHLHTEGPLNADVRIFVDVAGGYKFGNE